MPHPQRTQFVRLALIEGVVIALGVGLIGLFALVSCFIDPTLYPASLTPPSQ
jgi:hypothetical protein